MTPKAGLQLNRDADTEAYDPWRGRLVATLKSTGGELQPSAQLTVAVNRPDFRGELTTTLEYDRDRWTVEAALKARIQRGELDSLRFVVSEELVEPFASSRSFPSRYPQP